MHGASSSSQQRRSAWLARGNIYHSCDRSTRYGVNQTGNDIRLLILLKLACAALGDGDAFLPKNRNQTDIGTQLRRIGIACLPSFGGWSVDQRRTELARFGVFTFATREQEAFEAILEVTRMLDKVPALFQSKPRRAAWIADEITCPPVVAEGLRKILDYFSKQ